MLAAAENHQSTEHSCSFARLLTKPGEQSPYRQKSTGFISLAPNLTEIVYAIDAGDRLVGNTTYCDYPEQAKAVQKVGDTLQPNLERILAARPQLILISTSSQLEAFTKQLQEHQIPVYVTDPHDLEGSVSLD